MSTAGSPAPGESPSGSSAGSPSSSAWSTATSPASSSGSSSAGSAEKERRVNLTEAQRFRAIEDLLSGSTNGELARGAFTAVAQKYGCDWRQIKRAWKAWQEQKENGVDDIKVGNKRKGVVGPKGWDIDALRAQIKVTPMKSRTSIRGLAYSLNIPTTTLYRLLPKLGLKSHSRFLKPVLTDDNMRGRVAWAVRWLLDGPDESRRFHNQYNVVMLDEKWFYIVRNGEKYYILEDEQLPNYKVQHKSWIMKVMFTGVVARPRFDPHRNRYFNGKIGIFPYTKQDPAQRSSRNRPRGTLVTKQVEVTKEVYKKMLLDNVIPAIKDSWPAASRRETIYANHDNASPHRINDDPDIRAACSADGWDIQFINQPPNSPDCNILDLGFFNSIQSLQDQTEPRNIEELVTEVKRAFNAQKADKLEAVWTTLQAVLEQIMLAKGNNTFKLPHKHKETEARKGRPIGPEMPCSSEAWVAAQDALS